MSKELEALEFIKNDLIAFWLNSPHLECPNGKDFVKGHYKLDLIEKSLKALEIIKNKKVNVYELFSDKVLNPNCDDKTLCWNYNLHKEDYRCLTQEEYDLLKEVLL